MFSIAELDLIRDEMNAVLESHVRGHDHDEPLADLESSWFDADPGHVARVQTIVKKIGIIRGEI